MIEAFVYPVSAVMKFWHWLLADIFTVSPDTCLLYTSDAADDTR